MDTIREIKRLKFENILWIIFAVLCILNVVGDYDQELYLIHNNYYYKEKSDKIFEFTLTITLLIYIYFFCRNYSALKNASSNQKELYEIKLFGSIFLIVGIICLIYFQNKQTSFIGSPSL